MERRSEIRKMDDSFSYEYESTDKDFHLSKRFSHRLPHPFPRELLGKRGSWMSDKFALHVPWSRRFREASAEEAIGWTMLPETARPPLEGFPSEDQALTSTRMAIASAWQTGRYALKRERQRREAMGVVSHGYRRRIPGFPKHPVREVRSFAKKLDRGTSRVGLVAAARLSRKLGVDSAIIDDILCGVLVKEDKIRAWQNQMSRAATGTAGNNTAYEVPAFIVHLATWWWRVTGRLPERRETKGQRSDVVLRTRPLSFVAFTQAALCDATGTSVDYSRAIRTAIEGAEKRNPSPPAEWLNQRK